MKKITFLFIAIVTLCFSFSAKAQCNYTLEMNDSWGDGWNGNTMDVLVNGVEVLDDVTFTAGEGSPAGVQMTMTFAVNDGDMITTLWNGGGGFGAETSYRILDALGAEVGTGAETSITTAISALCPSCSIPDVTYNVIPNCPTDTDFTLEVVINDIGTASGVTITDDQGTAASGGLTAGTYSYGAYTNGTNVIITVTNDDDGTCTTSSAALTYNAANCPPSNDDFAGADPVACGMNYTGSTVDATLDEDYPGEPAGGADFDAPNVWFTYTGSGSAEEVTLSLCASDYDTGIMVFTGTSGNLTQVAENEDADACGANPPESYRSFLTFISDGTTTYYIAVEGWNVGDTGNYDLGVTCAPAIVAPANDLCANAEGLAVGVAETGTTAGATVEAADANPTCESGLATIVDVWYSFTASEADMTVITTLGTADQANVAVYEDCTLATQVGCSDANGGETLNLTGLTVSNTYLVRVWNDGIAPPTAPPAGRVEGDFTISVDATLSVDGVENPNAFTYYPNPVKNELTLSAQKDIQNVAVYNMLGQEVLRTSPNAVESTVDMNGLSQGAYFVQVTIGDVTKTVRVIKQ
ncbi:T9SS type A sorting domain-containing protein [uncultured Psychroserpens sp.]|uniref:T9SS type A sorting domain-containing protein n=1 Tax=uncultured Psychroserpens sp. TaxID=255436 RepID=UPI0026168D88|nr:T9SS type A sorting domain-containing protein [uncultured Psychroserpens sp.]